MIQLQRKIVLQPEVSINIVGFEVTSFSENKQEGYVMANLNLIDEQGIKHDRSGFMVWQGQDYNPDFQWGDTDLTYRITELLNQL